MNSSSLKENSSSNRLVELKNWLESKEQEVNNILSDEKPDSDLDADDINQGEVCSSSKSLNDAQNDFNLQAEILKQLTENLLAATQEDATQEAQGSEEFSETADKILDSSSVLLTPLTVKKKNRKDNHSSKRSVKSPLLRRKEIRTCINLHNDCENSDVLNEIMGPALNFGSTSVVDEPTPDPIMSNSESFEIDQPQSNNHSTFVDNSVANNSLESKFRRGNMSWFPWKTMSFLLLVSTAAIINADIQKHGGKFEKSNVGIFLQDIGQYDRLLILSQVVVDQYHVGKGWMDKNVPVYLKKAQPYVQLAQEKSLEAGAKLKTLSQTALVKLEEYVPGAQKQLNKFGDWSVKFGQNALNNCKILAVRAQETALDLMNGKITWCCIKSGAVKQFEFIQKQSLAAIEYLQAQFKQMTKSK